MAGCCHANGIVLFDIHGTAVPAIEALERGIRRLRRIIGMAGRFDSRKCLAKIYHLHHGGDRRCFSQLVIVVPMLWMCGTRPERVRHAHPGQITLHQRQLPPRGDALVAVLAF